MLPLFKVQVDTETCLQNVREVLESGYIGEGNWVDKFEKALEEAWWSDRRVLTVNSCTSALELALHMCGVKDKHVITTPQTCTATNTAIVSRGGKIVWADVDQFSGNITPESVKRLLEDYNDVAAIVCVDWGGTPVDYDELRRVANGIPIIEDAAHSYLTMYNDGFIANTGGDYVCYSFQAIKHLTTVDGGALIVPEGLEKRAELLRWYGLDRKSSASFRCAQTIQEAGFKFHMNNVAAAIGLANMDKALDGVVGSRLCAEHYDNHLKMGKGVIYIPTFTLNSSYWLYTILVKDRDKFVKYLEENGIAASPVHARNDKHPCFPPRNLNPEHRKGVDYFAEHNVSIPCGAWLTQEDLAKIIQVVNKWNEIV